MQTHKHYFFWIRMLFCLSFVSFSDGNAATSISARTITSIRHWTGPKSTRVVVDLSRTIKYRISVLHHPTQVVVYLPAVRLKKEFTHDIHDGLLADARAINYGKRSSQVIITLTRQGYYDSFFLTAPPRLVLDFRPAEPKSSKRATTGPKQNTIPNNLVESTPDTLTEIPLTRQLGLQAQRIVLDPGHGGIMTGAVSGSGVTEKELTLDIALRCEKILIDSGFTVLLTRRTDVHVPLEERTVFANQNQADLFISIHTNAHRKAVKNGLETFYLALATDNEAKETAALENAVSGNQLYELESILERLARSAFREESRHLAMRVQQAMVAAIGGLDRGVKTAPFYVLVGADMPAILVECGFISNPEEGEKLANADHRQKLAEAIVRGIIITNRPNKETTEPGM